MPRIKRIVPDLVRLSVAVEHELWRIERQRPLVASVINGLIAGAAVALVAFLI